MPKKFAESDRDDARMSCSGPGPRPASASPTYISVIPAIHPLRVSKQNASPLLRELPHTCAGLVVVGHDRPSVRYARRPWPRVRAGRQHDLRLLRHRLELGRRRHAISGSSPAFQVVVSSAVSRLAGYGPQHASCCRCAFAARGCGGAAIAAAAEERVVVLSKRDPRPRCVREHQHARDGRQRCGRLAAPDDTDAPAGSDTRSTAVAQEREALLRHKLRDVGCNAEACPAALVVRHHHATIRQQPQRRSADTGEKVEDQRRRIVQPGVRTVGQTSMRAASRPRERWSSHPPPAAVPTQLPRLPCPTKDDRQPEGLAWQSSALRTAPGRARPPQASAVDQRCPTGPGTAIADSATQPDERGKESHAPASLRPRTSAPSASSRHSGSAPRPAPPRPAARRCRAQRPAARCPLRSQSPPVPSARSAQAASQVRQLRSPVRQPVLRQTREVLAVMGRGSDPA